MKKWLMALAVVWLAGCGDQQSSARAGTAEWLTDLPKALAQAKAERKLVFMDFTGSDWCHPCMDLHDKVLTSPEFEAYAKTNFVLVVVDFPNSKPQGPELKKANQSLSDKFTIEGYPTIIVLDAEGKQLSKDTGYGGEKPAEFIAKLEAVRTKAAH